MFTVTIKDGARDANSAVERLASERGEELVFGSREAAEALAAELSETSGRVRIQKAAPQDPTDCDGYLISFPRRFTQEPKESDGTGLTFDIGANVYGEIGRALIYGTYGISPALRYYLFNETEGFSEKQHRLRRIQEPCLPDDVPASVGWSPDCLIQVINLVSGQVDHSFYCEIKTGSASFQRGQLEDMKTVSMHYGVLKIRVDVDRLPDEYTVRIDEVAAE